jgi:pimeloyl-ACP methyl ester carboxylesterase
LTLKFDRATLTRESRDLRKFLSQITCPILFLRGADSQNISAAALAEMVQSCLYARGVEIPSAGHHVFLDNPAAFLEAVRGFLDEETEVRK